MYKDLKYGLNIGRSFVKIIVAICELTSFYCLRTI